MIRSAIFIFLLGLALTKGLFAQVDELVQQEDTLLQCSAEQMHLDDKLALYTNLQVDNSEKYQVLTLKVFSIATKAKNLGYDTQELDNNLDTLEALTQTFENDHAALITSIESAQNLVCGTNELSYVNAKLGIINNLELLQNTASDIYALYNDDIKINLVSLKKVEVADDQ